MRSRFEILDGTHVAKGEQRQQWPTGEHFSTSAHYRMARRLCFVSLSAQKAAMVLTGDSGDGKMGNVGADRPYSVWFFFLDGDIRLVWTERPYYPFRNL